MIHLPLPDIRFRGCVVIKGSLNIERTEVPSSVFLLTGNIVDERFISRFLPNLSDP